MKTTRLGRSLMIGLVQWALLPACSSDGTGAAGSDSNAPSSGVLANDPVSSPCTRVTNSESPVARKLAEVDITAAWGFTADDSYLYWTTSDEGATEIFRLAQDGGEPESITTIGVESQRLFAHGDDLFLSADDGVHRVSKDGKEDYFLAAVDNAIWGSEMMAADEMSLYMFVSLDSLAQTGRLVSIDRETGAVNDLIEEVLSPDAVATDGKHVYFVADDLKPDAGDYDALYSLMRIPVTGGKPEFLAEGAFVSTDKLVVNGDYVYLSLELGPKPEPESLDLHQVLVRIPKSGGAIERLTSDCDLMFGIGSAGKNVIYQGGGQYYRYDIEQEQAINIEVDAVHGDTAFARFAVTEKALFHMVQWDPSNPLPIWLIELP